MATEEGDSYEVTVLVVLHNIIASEFLELSWFGHGDLGEKEKEIELKSPPHHEGLDTCDFSNTRRTELTAPGSIHPRPVVLHGS